MRERLRLGQQLQDRWVDGSGSGRVKYEVVGLLGRGGLGQVYEAIDHWVGGKVAIKVLGAGVGIPNGEMYEEAKTMARLNHPNIAKIFNVGVFGEDDNVYIVMEHLDPNKYNPIKDLVGGEIGKEFIARAVRGIASAMDYSYENGVLHRDLKPENVLVDEEGNPKLIDFGLSHKVVDDDTMIGTPPYMSWAMLQGEPHGLPSETAVFARLVGYMLTGDHLFKNRNGIQALFSGIVYQLRNETFPKLGEDLQVVVPGVINIAKVNQVLSLGLRNDVFDLPVYPTATAFADDLVKALAD